MHAVADLLFTFTCDDLFYIKDPHLFNRSHQLPANVSGIPCCRVITVLYYYLPVRKCCFAER